MSRLLSILEEMSGSFTTIEMECKSLEMSLNTEEQNVIEYERKNISDLTKHYADKKMPYSENSNRNYPMIRKENRNSCQVDTETENQELASRNFTCSISNGTRNSKDTCPTTTSKDSCPTNTTSSYGGARSKLLTRQKRNAWEKDIPISNDYVKDIQRKRNSKQEQYITEILHEDHDDENIIDENDITLAFNTDIDEKLMKEPTDINKRGNNEVCDEKIIHASESQNAMFIRDPEINNLGDALKYFKLYSQLQLLEIDFENVRRYKKSKESHEFDLKKFDKDIQKLSSTFHPDKVKQRGGSDRDIEIAQTLQTALNTTRTVLKILSEAFLEDINTDHRYGYYTKLNLSSLGNEEEIRKHIHEVLFKISYTSQIIQKNIIAEIQHFLIESKNCVKYFFDNDENKFEKCHHLAVFHLKKCIRGYKKLIAEYKIVQEECTDEKMDNMYAPIKKMSSETSRNLFILKEIKKVAKKSLTGICQFYSTPEHLDDYFVLPFANYINIIGMCNVILKKGKQTLWQNFKNSYQSEPVYNHATSFLLYLYYLSSFSSGNNKYKYIVEKTMGDKHMYYEEIKKEFSANLEQLNVYLEDKFKVENYYTENNSRNLLMEECVKCMRMVADFKIKEKELEKDIKKIASRNQEIEEKYDKAMKESMELNDKFQKSLEQSRLLREKFSETFATSYK